MTNDFWVRRMTTRKISFLSLVAALTASTGLAATGAKGTSPAPGTYITIPDTIVAGDEPGLRADVERGLFFVPENRSNPNSRMIAVAFIRFPALQAAGAGRAPVFLVAGGPGSDFRFKRPHEMRDVQRLRRTRDVVYISQRGNPIAPGLVAQMVEGPHPAPLDKAGSVAATRDSQRAAFKTALDKWTALGVDARGYDILNIVDDVHELRAALGYDKIVLRGCSFGSQWSFSYLKRWPRTVDRAWLSGVEPLDYAYDSPKWLWASLSRLAQQAEADPKLAPSVPRGGVIHALREIVEKLDRQPVTATIEDPRNGKPLDVTLGAADVQQLITYGGMMGGTRAEKLGNWPRFILEMQRGDFRYAAAKIWEKRTQEQSGEPLIVALIDNSLGITAQRDAQLLAEPEARWLGDINDYYHNTRDLTPTPRVGDAFRADWKIEVPVLLVNGDLDWSTPVENARHASRFLARGHYVEVEGGTHCGETVDMVNEQPRQMEQLYEFVDADFEHSTPEAYFAKLPDKVAYSKLTFTPLTGQPMYAQWLAQARKQYAVP